MNGYTELFVQQEKDMKYCEDHIEILAKTAKMFRPFSAALDEFLVLRGYNDDPNDLTAKTKYIKSKFDEQGIPFDSRWIKKWYTDRVRAEKRAIAFGFCFAFGLNIEETQEFFRKVYLQRGIDCHDVNEVVYYFAISHKLSYIDAQSIIEKVPKSVRENVELDGDVMFTDSIIKEIDQLESADELLTFLRDNIRYFGYNNVTAYKLINEVWNIISAENGLAKREAEIDERVRTSRSRRSVWDIYKQIFGLEYYDPISNELLFPMKKYDRTLSPMLENNSLIPDEVRQAFPDRQGLEGIIKGEHKSFEVVRKTMILLVFYKFCAERIVESENEYYASTDDEGERCRAEIDSYLIGAGYPELYEGNPYDWIFLVVMYSAQPLEAFREFIGEVYLRGLE